MLRPWELNLTIERESGVAVYLQIVNKIIDDIQSGRFTPGTALPGTRELANKFNVNRKTVIQAYDELIAQGWLVCESKRGTFVSTKSTSINHKLTTASNLQSNDLARADVTLIYKKQNNHDFINFSEGLPDCRLIPFEMLSRAMRHALITSARQGKSSYGDPKGAMILREAILQMLNMERGLCAKIENICIVRGSQMGIFLTARVLLNQNDTIVMEELSNPLARDVFRSCGANIVTVNVDSDGIDVEQLESICKENSIRAIYVSPSHQIPTTACMTISRRKRLLALAEQYDFLIIEDDTDFEFNYSNENISPLAGMDKSERVIYIGSLSKVLSPGLRVGYIVAPENLINSCANQVRLIDRQGDVVTELAVAELMHTGAIKNHNLRTVKIYEERYAFTSSLLRTELNEYAKFQTTRRGLAIWLELNREVDMNKLIEDAELEKVSFTPAIKYSSIGKHHTAIRLGFANLNHEEIKMGINRLKKVLFKQKDLLAAR